jgi:hypothetical protein
VIFMYWKVQVGVPNPRTLYPFLSCCKRGRPDKEGMVGWAAPVRRAIA